MSDLRPKLSRTERIFLAEKRVPIEFVADMRHRSDWASCSDELRACLCYFAWGFRKCEDGHRLTNGKGRCIQCHPATIGFVMRHARPGWLYIAKADGKRLTKVGIASDVDSRLAQLNAHRLAGVACWRPAHVEYCENPAALEAELIRRLENYRQVLPYERKGGQVGREVFACTPAKAIEALAEIYLERPDW